MRRLVLVRAARSAVVGLSRRALLERWLILAVADICTSINALKHTRRIADDPHMYPPRPYLSSACIFLYISQKACCATHR